jgi:hypothetical protein
MLPCLKKPELEVLSKVITSSWWILTVKYYFPPPSKKFRNWALIAVLIQSLEKYNYRCYKYSTDYKKVHCGYHQRSLLFPESDVTVSAYVHATVGDDCAIPWCRKKVHTC